MLKWYAVVLFVVVVGGFVVLVLTLVLTLVLVLVLVGVDVGGGVGVSVAVPGCCPLETTLPVRKRLIRVNLF